MPEVHALTREPRRKCRVGDSCGVCDDSGTVRIGNAESRGRVLRNTQLGYPPPPPANRGRLRIVTVCDIRRTFQVAEPSACVLSNI